MMILFLTIQELLSDNITWYLAKHMGFGSLKYEYRVCLLSKLYHSHFWSSFSMYVCIVYAFVSRRKNFYARLKRLMTKTFLLAFGKKQTFLLISYIFKLYICMFELCVDDRLLQDVDNKTEVH
mgnify:CR=1 FL=1